ncbi:MAG: hypothetical protein KJ950_06905 [Proteobacteria bacterium]|nr:hypothetical protein [Pseudomonadota bacterium]MBU1686770.1 hypothetical protein [Pseudomonadota bacterium]
MKSELLKIPTSQRGMALVSALLLILVISVTVVGISMDTSMDVRIAAYQQFKARSFGFSEGGMIAAGDILEDNAFNAGWDNPADPAPFPYPNLSPDYVGDSAGNKIDILGDGSFYMDENVTGDVKIRMKGDLKAEIRPQRLVAKITKGGALQVAAGYAGIGKGLGGGGATIVYNLVSTGHDADQTQTDLAMHYRYITK